MPTIRKWKPEGPFNVTFECPFYHELLSGEENGRLPRDLEAHALWQYYGMALFQYKRAKENLVEESELSEIFDVIRARQIFIGVANLHGMKPERMCRYWPEVEKQRSALGAREELPEVFKFKHWSN